MTEAVITVQECVSVPERQDKPHRRLSLSMAINEEDPGNIEIFCKQDGSTLFLASIPVKCIRVLLDTSYVFQRDSIVLDP